MNRPDRPVLASSGAPALVPVIADIERAAALLRSGGLVAIPTETVYGLAADAEREDAVARIFSVKGRPVGHPLIVHLASAEQVDDGWADVSDGPVRDALALLAGTCWPGSLTLVLPRGRRVIGAVTGGRSTVAIRVPAHRDAQALLTAFGGGLAAPSANRFGTVSPTSASDVLADLGALLDPERDAIVDGGRCPVGLESTIVDLTVDPYQVLRAGAIDVDSMTRILAAPFGATSGPSRASGMLASHYAPRCDVQLADDRATAEALVARLTTDGRQVRLLDRTDDLTTAAFELYADLRTADRDHIDTLVVVLPKPTGLGHAIRDRLIKAAASRTE